MTSSTMVFSASGVSAATTWPTIETPNAMTTLRLCAMRNGSSRRNQPPASGGAGSGVGRSGARTRSLLQHTAECGEPVEHGGAVVAQHVVELRRHGPLRVPEGARARPGELEGHAAAVTGH